MALKNSKTGSLPVSEIYNFMTEHFPYFKVSLKATPSMKAGGAQSQPASPVSKVKGKASGRWGGGNRAAHD